MTGQEARVAERLLCHMVISWCIPLSIPVLRRIHAAAN